MTKIEQQQLLDYIDVISDTESHETLEALVKQIIEEIETKEKAEEENRQQGKYDYAELNAEGAFQLNLLLHFLRGYLGYEF